MSNNELYEHKRSDTVKWVLTLFAFILVGVMLAGVILGWFDKKEEPPAEEEQQQQTEEGGELVVNDGISNGISLMSVKIAAADFEAYGVSPLAESAQQVTASVQPSDALNKEVDWSIAWANPSSEWATGKTVTDYVMITPTSDGALTATVACLQAFGEQMIVTATSRDNTSAKGTCTVDYSQRYLGTETYISFNNSQYYQIGAVSTFMDSTSTVNLPNKAQAGHNTNTTYSPKNKMTYGVCLSDTYSLPLEDGVISFEYYIKMNPAFVSALKSESTTFTDANMAVDWELFNEASGTLSKADAVPSSGGGVTSSEEYTVIDYYYIFCNSLRTAVAPEVYYINPTALTPFIRAALEIDDYHFEVKVVAEYGGETYETVSKMKFNESSLNIPVSSVSAGPDVVF